MEKKIAAVRVSALRAGLGGRRGDKDVCVILAPPFVYYTMFSKFFNLCEPQFPYLLNGDSNSPLRVDLMIRLDNLCKNFSNKIIL